MYFQFTARLDVNSRECKSLMLIHTTKVDKFLVSKKQRGAWNKEGGCQSRNLLFWEVLKWLSLIYSFAGTLFDQDVPKIVRTLLLVVLHCAYILAKLTIDRVLASSKAAMTVVELSGIPIAYGIFACSDGYQGVMLVGLFPHASVHRQTLYYTHRLGPKVAAQ